MEAKEFAVEIQVTVLSDNRDQAVEYLRMFCEDILSYDDVVQVYGDVISNVTDVKESRIVNAN